MSMESRLQKNSPDTRPVPVYVLPYADQDDEISLVDLWRVIVARKKLILLSTLVAIVLAATYIFLAEPWYRTEVSLLPPQQQTIQALMTGNENLGLIPYTPALVYSAFLVNLDSKGVRRDFFDTHNLAEYYLEGKPQTDAAINDVFEKRFSQNIQVQTTAPFTTVSFEGPNPELTAERLNQFVAFANERTVQQVAGNVNEAVQARIERIHSTIAGKLKSAVQRRQDRVLQLQEALRIARVMGIESTGSFSALGDKEKMAVEVNLAQVPLYTRGVKALEAEITALESRKSDEPFISGLRDMQERLSSVETLLVNPDKLSALTLDAAAAAPSQAEKPRTKLVFLLAGVLGLMIGVFLVFFGEFLSKVQAGSR